MQQIDYNAIIKNLENYRLPKKCSTRKKFKKRFGGQREAYKYEVIRIERISDYYPNVIRKCQNHIKAQNKTNSYTTNKKVIEKYKSVGYHRCKKSKGMFNFSIRFGSNMIVNIKRRKIELLTAKCKLDLNDKSERFTASIEYDLNFDFFEKAQQILKQKPSGNYTIYIGV